MIERLRIYFLLLLAGKSTVIINAKIERKKEQCDIYVNGNSLIHTCELNGLTLNIKDGATVEYNTHGD